MGGNRVGQLLLGVLSVWVRAKSKCHSTGTPTRVSNLRFDARVGVNDARSEGTLFCGGRDPSPIVERTQAIKTQKERQFGR